MTLKEWLNEPKKELEKRRKTLLEECAISPQKLRNWKAGRISVPKVYREKIEEITGVKMDWPEAKITDDEED